MVSKSPFFSFLKSLSKRKSVRVVAAFLGSLYLRLVYHTSRWTREGEEHPQLYWRENTPIIVCFWHGRLLMTAYAWRAQMAFAMLISAHSDGEIIARTVGHLGIRWIPGSVSRHGVRASRELLRALRAGSSVGITPDGPRGPRHEVSAGTARLALMAGVDVLPLAFSVHRHRFLKTWDRFLLALPFSRGALVWGPPLSATAYKGREEMFRVDLQHALMTTTERADAICQLETPC